MAINKELTIERINDEIRISIGVKALAFAIENGPDWPSDEYKIDSSDKYEQFGASILQYLEQEEEDGTTPIHRLFDAVANEALEQGADGFLDVENE
jgi:hypothetical protein